MQQWIAKRMSRIEVSGVRRVFDLARTLTDPVNLSIGQPHFQVPEAIKQATIRAIEADHNGYTVTQGIASLRAKLHARFVQPLGHPDRELFITSGTSGGIILALLATVNPGDEVICFDPYFAAYPNMIQIAGGVMVAMDTYPDFRIDPAKLEAAITPRTKMIIFNSPANPTGVVADAATTRAVAQIARERGILLLSDEIYRIFCYDGPLPSPVLDNDQTLVIDGFGKAYGITGWRLGFAHGPRPVIEEMLKLQQFSFVCAPSPSQYGAEAALDVDTQPYVDDYRRKRDWLCEQLARLGYEVVVPGGAFYLFVRAPWGSGSEFVTEAIRNHLLIIPGGVFSRRDTHFRISYAADERTLQRGVEILRAIRQRR
jgi:aspartate/methionine/tyrosine aminotransferase